MESIYYDNLIQKVIDLSESNDWDNAVTEWEITDCAEDETCSSECVCGKENIKYLYTINNIVNGKTLYYIGSSCIRKFGREDLSERTNVLEKLFELKHAVENGEYIKLDSKYFSRKLLKFLYDEGAFIDTEYNNYDGENDYQFMMEMFNKRNKSEISEARQKKIKAILLNSIKPYLLKTMKKKIR